MSLQRDEQGSFLAGAITMLGGLRLLQCPGSIAMKDVRDRIDKRRLAGQSRFDDRLSWEILIVHYSMGCSLDPLVFDSLDPALRKKLPNTQ